MRRTSLLIVLFWLSALTASPAMGQNSKLVSFNNTGSGTGNTSSYPASMSADGRFVAFDSAAFNISTVNDSNGAGDVFVRDMQQGTTILVSVNRTGTGTGNGSSGSPVISPDGRYVLFGSSATDLVDTNDTNGAGDLFVRDLQTATTTLVTINYAGTGAGSVPTTPDNLPFSYPVMSSDGRFVAFHSVATDLVRNDTNNASDIFVRDLQAGVTTLVSINKTHTTSGNRWSRSPAISADGRYVTFYSSASDLVSNPDLNSTSNCDVFVRDMQSGTTSLVSINHAGTGTGNQSSLNPVISANGRFVAFQSDAFDLVTTSDNALRPDIFVRDLVSGTTTLVSVNSAGAAGGNGFSDKPAISGNGRYVVFTSNSTDLVTLTDANFNNNDVFVRDLQTGKTSLVSVNATGNASGNGVSALNSPAINYDGRFVAFVSNATDLVQTSDSNSTSDLFLRDVVSKTTTLISINKTGTASGNNSSGAPIISSNGRFVAFQSVASDLVANPDTNNTSDVFLAESFTLSSLTVTPSTVVGGSLVTGRVALSAPAPAGGVVVSLTNGNGAATVPSSISIPAGGTSKTFVINTSPVTTIQSGAITATLGTARRSATLKVRPVGLLSVSISPNSITGGNAATGTVTLEQAAPNNVTVKLSDNAAATTIPASLVVPQGATSKTFSITTTTPSTTQNGLLTASANGTTKTAPFTVSSGGTSSCAAITFTMGQKIVVDLRSLVADDFNRDGKPDVAGVYDSRVYILLGNGQGGFNPPISMVATARADRLIAVDFNRDGKPDLAVTDAMRSTITVLLGDGSGHFTKLASVSSGSSPSNIKTGDFNNDGKPDIAVTNTNAGNSNKVAILLGSGNGGLSAPTYTPTNHADGLVVGDFNNDGNQDVAVASEAPPSSPIYPSGAVEILLGNGAGGFSAATGRSLGRTALVGDVAAGDFNGDGKLDLTVRTGTYGNAGSFRVAVMLGDGLGGFGAPTRFVAGQGPDQILVADLNGDSKADLIVANTDSHSVSVLLGNGAGGFSPAKNYSVGTSGPQGVTVGDFNGDGKPDLAVSILHNVAVLINSCG